MARGWMDMLRGLGEAFVELLGAEVAALKEDLSTTGRRLAVALGLVALALFLLFWAIAAAAFLLFHVLALWLSGWAAALIVFLVFLLTGLVIAAVARRRLRALEPPAQTVRRRIEDHRQWWGEKVMVEGGPRSREELPPSGDSSVGRSEVQT